MGKFRLRRPRRVAQREGAAVEEIGIVGNVDAAPRLHVLLNGEKTFPSQRAQHRPENAFLGLRLVELGGVPRSGEDFAKRASIAGASGPAPFQAGEPCRPLGLRNPP